MLVQDAAELYERAGMHEKAAIIYIQGKAFGLAAPLMALITHNPKLQLEFARAKESKFDSHCCEALLSCRPFFLRHSDLRTYIDSVCVQPFC